MSEFVKDILTGGLAGYIGGKMIDPKEIVSKIRSKVPEALVTPADVIVYRDGDFAVAVDGKTKLEIYRSRDHATVWQKAVDILPEHGLIVGLGEFIFKNSVSVKKPVTIMGGKFIRDKAVGTNSNALFNVGSGKNEEPVYGLIRFTNCYFDGNERNITQEYTEYSGAPVHVGLTIGKLHKIIIENCIFKDMAREAIWIPCIECQEGVIDHEEIIINNNFFENIGYGTTAESYNKLIVSNNIVKGLNSGSAGASTSNPNYFVAPNYLDCHHTIISNNIVDGEVPSGYPNEGSWGFTLTRKGGEINTYSFDIIGNTLTHLKSAIYIVPPKSRIIGNYIYDVNNGIMTGYAKYSHIIANTILKFTGTGIFAEGDSNSYAEGNIVAYNIIDDDGQSAQYGIKMWTYARWNIIMYNTYLGSIQTPHYVWVGPNITTDGIVGSLDDLTNALPNMPFLRGNIPMWYYDGTNYYLVQVDLVNKTLRKVQVS